MTLKSKIFVKKFRESEVPAFAKKIETLLSKSVPVEVDMESFDVMYNSPFLEFEGATESFHTNCFNPLLKTLQNMCEEPMMKEHLIEHLQSIHIANIRDVDVIYGTSTFVDGILTVRAPVTSDTGPHKETLIKIIFESINQAA